MKGEMTPLSTCLLFTVSPDDTAARTAVPTHEMHTIYVCQHCHTIVHVRYTHAHERHAWYGRVGQYCSLPTMLIVLQRGVQGGEVRYTTQHPCDYTVYVCLYTLQHSNMHSHSMPACCTWCNGMRWYILPSRPTTRFHPRIMDFIVMPHTPITSSN